MAVKNLSVGGLAASFVLAVFLVAEAFSGFVPAYNLIEMIHRLIGGLMIYGWLGYAVVGVVAWPVVFGLVSPRLSSRSGVARGLVFGIGAWAAMMLLFLPIVGAGFFGIVIGWAVPGIALVQHLLYGAVLGLMNTSSARPSRKRRRRR